MEHLREFKYYEIIREKHENEFIKEPIEEYIKNFGENKNEKKIILTGGRGIGKSTLLSYMQQCNNQFYMPFVLTEFNPIDLPKNTSEKFDEDFLEHYFEEKMAIEILKNIATYYEFDYRNLFLDYEKEVKEKSSRTKKYIEKNGNMKFENKFSFGKITRDLIADYKSFLNSDYITLAIDHFDWLDNGNGMAQKILSQYFNLFNKVLITSDDSTLFTTFKENEILQENGKEEKIQKLRYKILEQEKRLEKLHKKGYVVQSINYGCNPIIVQNILLKFIEYYNHYYSVIINTFPKNIITEDFINVLIYKTNGNISNMINIIIEIYKVWLHQEYLDSYGLIQIINSKLEQINSEQIIRSKTKLYL